MLASLLAPTLLACTLLTTTPAPRLADSSWNALYDRGVPFSTWVTTASKARADWNTVAERARTLDTALVTRARAVGGQWRFLIVAAEHCGDSVNGVPYLAALTALVPGLDLRIVTPDVGRALQEANRSWDSRLVTPTIVVLNAKGQQAGCIVERSRPARHGIRNLKGTVPDDSLGVWLRAFYKADAGRGMIIEAVELLEAAKANKALCERGQAVP